MRLQIGKWGNSLAVRLPTALLQKVLFKEGDVLEVQIEPDGTLHLLPTHNFDKSAFLFKLNKLRQKLPGTKSVIETMRQEQRY
jgi:antitoxin MazE